MNDQAAAALALANATRLAVANAKKQLKSGELTASDVIAWPAIRDRYVFEVLGWQKGWGTEKVERVMAEMDAYNPVCSALSPRQLRILARMCALGRGKQPFDGTRADERARAHDRATQAGAERDGTGSDGKTPV